MTYTLPGNLLLRNRRFILLLFFIVTLSACQGQTGLTADYLRVEYKENPFTDVEHPRLSWELYSSKDEQVQTAYQILVASSKELLDKNVGDLWDTGKVAGNATNQIVYDGAPIEDKTRVYWKVRSWDKNDVAGQWSEPSWWETGISQANGWTADWIGLDLTDRGKGTVYHLPPASYVRKEQKIEKEVSSARLYVTALGIYEFYINGDRVADEFFAPGWTDYNKRVYYNVYDISEKLKKGENVFSATLSYGWYAGYLGYALLVGAPQVRNFYGDVPLLKAQLEITYTDGSVETVVTNSSWKAGSGPLIESDFQQGETYDARLLEKGWDKSGFDDSKWRTASVYPQTKQREITIYPGEPVKVIREFNPKTITAREEGKYIVDFGQNFAGVVRLKVKGNEGDTIVLRYGEMLHPDGSLVTENLRMARATDTYILSGDPDGETWQPQFTFHGFQFVEVSGLPERPDNSFLKGIALSSSVPVTGKFETDNQVLNQLYSNILWTQWANHIDIPTDCPQRDERLGWAGDAQIYMRSSTFNNDVSSFHTKWLVDLNDSQWPDGSYPIYAPMPVTSDGQPALRLDDTYCPGWSEAGIICVHEQYRTYGDVRMVDQSFPYMENFMRFLDEKAQGKYVFREGSFEEINPKGGYGDWLSIGKKTPPDLLASFYYEYCAKLMMEMSEGLERQDKADYYRNRQQQIKKAILAHYTDESGKFIVDEAVYGDGSGYIDGERGFDSHTQTTYANAIYMELLDADHTAKAGDWLRELIEVNDNKLSTGFLGFRPLLPALSATGNTDVAYKLLLSTEYPSLGFEVMNGATSIWERWDSYTKEHGFVHNASMNSFSHYAFGAVNEWMLGNMAGIKTDGPGYRNLIIKPEIAPEGINHVNAEYRSINGWIKSAWQKDGDKVQLNVSIPVNTRAKVYVPARSIDDVLINGRKLSNTKWKEHAVVENGFVVIDVGSGDFRFASTLLADN